MVVVGRKMVDEKREDLRTFEIDYRAGKLRPPIIHVPASAPSLQPIVGCPRRRSNKWRMCAL